MGRTVVTRHIAAPVEVVFNSIANIDEFSKILPHVVKVEHLTPQHSGLGARFRETRLMNGTEYPTELETTEYVPNDRVRMVAVTHGVTWDTLFSVKHENGRTTLTAAMEWRGGSSSQRIMMGLMSGMMKTAIAKDLDLVKKHCEGLGPA